MSGTIGKIHRGSENISSMAIMQVRSLVIPLLGSIIEKISPLTASKQILTLPEAADFIPDLAKMAPCNLFKLHLPHLSKIRGISDHV